MTWLKSKTAIALAVCALLAAGTVIIILCRESKTMQSIQSDWSVIRGDSGQWSFDSDKIEAHSTTGETILASSEQYGDVTFSAVATSTDWDASLAVRLQDAKNGYFVIYVPPYTRVNPNAYIRLDKRVAGRTTTLASYKKQKVVEAGRLAKITVVAKGASIEVFLNGDEVLEADDSTFDSGYIGFRIFGGLGSYPGSATFSNVKFY